MADGASWALSIVFALAAMEKTLTLSARAAAWHPVMLASSGRRRWATKLMVCSLLADVVAVILLIAWPLMGAVVAAALLVAYSIAAGGVHVQPAHSDCRCMWKLLNASSKRGFVVRNAFLLLLASLIVTLSPSRPAQRLGLIWGAILLATILVATRIADQGAWLRGAVAASSSPPHRSEGAIPPHPDTAEGQAKRMAKEAQS